MTEGARRRTTVERDDDVAVGLLISQKQWGVGPDEAVNRLLRTGLAACELRERVLRPADVGLRADVSNIGDALDTLDES